MTERYRGVQLLWPVCAPPHYSQQTMRLIHPQFDGQRSSVMTYIPSTLNARLNKYSTWLGLRRKVVDSCRAIAS